ncbi:serine/threonine protein kinase [Mycobacterium asiaticum]|uniref:non-specific serine/threonine protein kinase n=1 Tax=Mycobacterium asiaticum TaxID=1790 RepID=A0A1A3P1S6_MYCAS|nr:serine/threonine-protein kinase [Mycobacterium asiaticum]OBK27224.1 serine/threonine protein kinase [Mycobacterium asiaticum]
MPTSADEGGSLRAGELFAGYTIVRRLGAGGMGEVYLAQHPRLPRRDALKILPADFTSNLEYRQRFNREADLAGSLYNQHIVGIHDRGEYHGQLWLSMDYVEGTDAAWLLHDQYPTGLPLPDVIEIVAAVADALDYAHARGLLHRDVKPANILLGEANPRRRILLADFGIARQQDDVSGLTATGMLMGTAAYCSPEQLQGSDLDGRADQYALGCTAFQLLTGIAPFHNANPAVVISQHLSAPPPSLSALRPELAHLDPVIARALAKDRSARFASCSDFAAALGGQARMAVAPQPPTMPSEMGGPPLMAPPARRGVGRATLVAALVAVALVAVAAVLGFVVLRGGSEHQSASPSRQPGTPRLTTPSNSSATPSALRLNSFVTDEARVLKPAEHGVIERAVQKLFDSRGTQLWVVYVRDFGGIRPMAWAENVMHANGFTDKDAMLAISTERRSFVFHVPAAVVIGKPIDVEEIRTERIAPAVDKREWTRAALAAVYGLDVGPR